MTRRRQALIGLGLALLLVGGWLAAQYCGARLIRLEGRDWLAAPPLALLICWLDVGLFIVAHDAMHGSLAPGRPRLNRLAGRIALILYAGFSFDRMRSLHFDHHRSPGTAADPDFGAEDPRAFPSW